MGWGDELYLSLCVVVSLLSQLISLPSWLLVWPICEALTEWIAALTLHCGPNQCGHRDVYARGQGHNLPDSCIPLQRAQHSDRLCSFIPLANLLHGHMASSAIAHIWIFFRQKVFKRTVRPICSQAKWKEWHVRAGSVSDTFTIRWFLSWKVSQSYSALRRWC